jgi:hypothetical protein
MRLPVYLMNEKDEFGHSLLTYLSSHKYQSKHQGSEKHTKALFTSHPNPKYFLFHPSHQIFRRMHGALNVGKKDN